MGRYMPKVSLVFTWPGCPIKWVVIIFCIPADVELFTVCTVRLYQAIWSRQRCSKQEKTIMARFLGANKRLEHITLFLRFS